MIILVSLCNTCRIYRTDRSLLPVHIVQLSLEIAAIYCRHYNIDMTKRAKVFDEAVGGTRWSKSVTRS